MKYNFNSGPSVLPQQVLEQAAQSILNFNDSGLSLLEIGHRTPLFLDAIEEAQALVKELLALDADHEVLFLQGGATMQFMQIPMNLLDKNETAAYADTGVWGYKAYKEAELFGNVQVVCSSRDSNYNYLPKDFAVPNHARYFHLTTNNTIYGTQWENIPFTSNSMVADMSSDIFSRQLDFNRFDLIYAGAQKNIGPAGATLVIINKKILGKTRRTIPTLLDYRNHIKEHSVLNTPPVFAVYVCLLTLRWLKEKGGIAAMEALNRAKAEKLYAAIDTHPLFEGTVAPADRSKMNVCFVMKEPALEKEFLAFAKKHNIVGIEGHRSVGGFRASLYNAMTMDGVDALIKTMQTFPA